MKHGILMLASDTETVHVHIDGEGQETTSGSSVIIGKQEQRCSLAMSTEPLVQHEMVIGGRSVPSVFRAFTGNLLTCIVWSCQAETMHLIGRTDFVPLSLKNTLPTSHSTHARGDTKGQGSHNGYREKMRQISPRGYVPSILKGQTQCCMQRRAMPHFRADVLVARLHAHRAIIRVRPDITTVWGKRKRAHTVGLRPRVSSGHFCC